MLNINFYIFNLGAIAVTSGRFRSTDLQLFMLQVNCTGMETNLTECGIANMSIDDCKLKGSDAGVICQGITVPFTYATSITHNVIVSLGLFL